MTLMRIVGIAGLLLLGAAAAPPAVAQGRGDHDTPATQGQWESGRWQYSPPECRTSADGWVMCRDRDGYWQRDHYDPEFGYRQGYGGGYGYDVLPPYAIVGNLQRTTSPTSRSRCSRASSIRSRRSIPTAAR
jgi:hypothetical protein